MRYIDLFAGIGGFHQAMEKAGGTCVFACEKDAKARQTYLANYSDKYPGLHTEMFAKDIVQIEPETIPNFDILCAGFPCQAFSNAGHKRGFQDTRGTLFFNIAEILIDKRPPVILLENVRNLLTHDSCRTFSVIMETLVDIGYKVFHKVIDSSDHGVPQSRKRLYIVGFLDHSIQFEFPESEPLNITMSDIFGAECNKRIGYTLRCGGRRSGIHDRHNWDGYLVNGHEVILGVREAKAMQGFPDNMIFPVSENQAMKQLGNSVSVPVVYKIVESIKSALSNI